MQQKSWQSASMQDCWYAMHWSGFWSACIWLLTVNVCWPYRFYHQGRCIGSRDATYSRSRQAGRGRPERDCPCSNPPDLLQYRRASMSFTLACAYAVLAEATYRSLDTCWEILIDTSHMCNMQECWVCPRWPANSVHSKTWFTVRSLYWLMQLKIVYFLKVLFLVVATLLMPVPARPKSAYCIVLMDPKNDVQHMPKTFQGSAGAYSVYPWLWSICPNLRQFAQSHCWARYSRLS